jgi:ABC-type transporter Mla MlaB component
VTSPRPLLPHAPGAYRDDVRAQGLVTAVPGAEAGDHLCWVYDDDAAFDAAARQFLAQGLARGERLLCVGERVMDGVQGGVTPVAGVERLLAEGRLELLTVAQAYAATGRFAPERQLAFYDAATQRAVDDGYRGLRVIAEVTPLAEDPASRAGLVGWEHRADEFMASGSGMSAMCAYRSDLPSSALADVATAHPLVHAPLDVPPFRMFFDEGCLALAGSVDTFDADRLATLLATSRVRGPVAVLDLTFLDFVDGAGCRALARWVRDLAARSIAVELRSAPRVVQRMWSILDFDRLAPVTFTGAGA